MSTFAVQVRTFKLVPEDKFVWVDAPDEIAALLGGAEAARRQDPATHHLLRQVLGATPMGDNTPANLVEVVVDYDGDTVEVELL